MDSTLDLRPLLTLKITLDQPIRVGHGPYGYRSVFGGQGTFRFDHPEFEGFSGDLLRGPADFCLTDHTKQWLTVDVRSALRVRQPRDFTIYMHYSGAIHFPPKVADTINQGGTIPFASSQFIVQPNFEVGDQDPNGNTLPDAFRDRIRKLNGIKAVGHAQLGPLSIEYRVYEIFNRYNPL
jgi:hypothetical protein